MACNTCKTDKECPRGRIDFKCLDYTGVELDTIAVDSGMAGDKILRLIDKAIYKNRATLNNVGNGSEVYKGLSDNMIHEFKTLLAQDGVIIEEKDTTIVFKVDEKFLKKWLDTNLANSLTPDMIKGIFNLEEFKTYFAKYLQGIISRPEFRIFFEEFLWSIFGSQSFQTKFIDFLKVIYNEDTWKSFYLDYLKMMFNKDDFRNFFVTYISAIFNNREFKDFFESYLQLIFNNKWFTDLIKSLTINYDDPDFVKVVTDIIRDFVESDDFCTLITPKVREIVYTITGETRFKNIIFSIISEYFDKINICDLVKNCNPGTPTPTPSKTIRLSSDIVANESVRPGLRDGVRHNQKGGPSGQELVDLIKAVYSNSKSLDFVNVQYGFWPVDQNNQTGFNTEELNSRTISVDRLKTLAGEVIPPNAGYVANTEPYGPAVSKTIKIRVQDSEGDWSNWVDYIINYPEAYPANGTEISRRCEGTTLVRVLADGRGGTREERSPNATECGYVPNINPNLSDVVVNVANREQAKSGLYDLVKAQYNDPDNNQAFDDVTFEIKGNLEGRLQFDRGLLAVPKRLKGSEFNKITYNAKNQDPEYSERVEVVIIG